MRVSQLLVFGFVLSSIACSASSPDGNPGSSGGNGTPNAGGTTSTGGSGVGGSGVGGSGVGGSGVGGSAATGSGGGANGGGVATGGTSAGGSAGVTDTGSHVMTWVPPYRVEQAKGMLESDFGGIAMKDGLTYLGLQFWITDGPSTRLDAVTEDDITWFHDWGKDNGVKVLLCLHNYVDENGWNWPEAVRSYRDNREAFVTHLLNEVEVRDLDGIDLDMEGIVDPTEDETTAFYDFARDLADGLHPKGKVVTVASFHGQWNAPNWNWWPTLLTIVDGIETMGYEQSGLNVDYATLTERASTAPEKLMIGVPSHVGEWHGHTATEHLDWIVDQGQIGTAIWDAALLHQAWRDKAVWERLATIRNR